MISFVKFFLILYSSLFVAITILTTIYLFIIELINSLQSAYFWGILWGIPTIQLSTIKDAKKNSPSN